MPETTSKQRTPSLISFTNPLLGIIDSQSEDRRFVRLPPSSHQQMQSLVPILSSALPRVRIVPIHPHIETEQLVYEIPAETIALSTMSEDFKGQGVLAEVNQALELLTSQETLASAETPYIRSHLGLLPSGAVVVLI